MTKEAREKSDFRKTSKWKYFRKDLQKKRKVDAVTGKPLLKGWQLHHCDMSTTNYKDLSNEDNFECLNINTHKVVHFLFRYKNWRELLKNLERILEKMETLNNGQTNLLGDL